MLAYENSEIGLKNSEIFNMTVKNIYENYKLISEYIIS